ncbi:Isobutyryl-CoA dehydrogenase, mitochondrial [Linnemannia hyalina]|uniref:Isobutyryl-CoA dehydrogenase, mitochondrial n=1 Tax=Linnemannia hyalina TaxID=64524 RepID=A0A9P8BS42_9FUNG|nr:Isobutyryl-CoA dehydrogenase, mitochondrial [Linnemannia hyalina]
MTLHNMCGGIIDTFGTEEQRQKYLPRLTSMELFSSYCLTEPGAGSDAANLSTKAVKKGSHYVLNGSKAFISGAGASEVYLILARTSGAGPKGVSCFIVEKGFKGLSFGKKERKVGWNSQPTRAVIMEDCEVPAENLVGFEGQGFNIAMSGLNGSRLNIGAAQGSLEATLEYVKDRKRSGDSSAGFQTEFKLADLATSLVSSRLMIREAAAALDRGDSNASLYSSMAKLNASERCFSIIDECFQLLGGCGYLEDHKLNVYLRDARVHRILGGTSEIMHSTTALANARVKLTAPIKDYIVHIELTELIRYNVVHDDSYFDLRGRPKGYAPGPGDGFKPVQDLDHWGPERDHKEISVRLETKSTDALIDSDYSSNDESVGRSKFV